MDAATFDAVDQMSRRLFARRTIQYVPASTTVRVRKNGVAVFRCMGAGGSGARSRGNGANGGNAGTVGIKAVPVTAGDAFTVVIPAGGAVAAGTTDTAGADGGTLTITGPGVNISIPGGKGGVVRALAEGAAYNPYNADPTGLDTFTLGGRGGAGLTGNNQGAGGGGAAALLVGGTAHDAGLTAHAGAGVGGTSNGYNPGGSGGPGTTTFGPNLFGEAKQASAPASIESSVLLVDVFGGGSYSNTPAGPGGGGGGGGGGGFGGGGQGLGVSVQSQVAGSGGRGGGGGGVRYTGSTVYTCTPGAGGDGWVTVEFFEEEV